VAVFPSDILDALDLDGRLDALDAKQDRLPPILQACRRQRLDAQLRRLGLRVQAQQRFALLTERGGERSNVSRSTRPGRVQPGQIVDLGLDRFR
jgi:hypothetical protein